jgi:hypothetical protein
MNVLLLSMPDYFEHMPPVAGRMPNGALTALAGNIDDRGCTLRSVLGLEDDRKAFERYKAIRHREWEYV